MILGVKLGVGLSPGALDLGVHLGLLLGVSAWNYYAIKGGLRLVNQGFMITIHRPFSIR